MKQVFATLICALCIVRSSFAAETGGEKFGGVVINNDWTFAMGNAASKELDYTHGTEYFTYICKAQSSNHSHAPIMPEFDDSSWQKVSLPHDWAVDLPYSPEASHSHGYKCIGWRYPENSVGWYRKHIEIPAEDKGKQFFIEFEGIYRDSEVFCNGFYLGGERSGYASSVYTLTPYLNYGGDNVIAVRCDASLEEGWYYEGAGIYRNVRLYKSGPVSMKHYSLKISQKKADGSIWTVSDGTADVYVDESCIDFDYILADAAVNRDKVTREIEIRDAEGRRVERADRRWSIDSPYLYTLTVRLFYDGELSDVVTRRFGVRTLEFSPEKGLLLNGEAVKLRGANMHLDHAGVGVAVTDELWRYRISRLQEYGFNAVRTSHNCASVSMLDLCDEMGVLVIDENRQFGVNQEQLRQLRNMIDRDRNHPSVILWSVGNEEWAVEHGEKGVEIARRMSEAVHGMDRTRPSTYGNAGGPDLVKGVDVFGYNYIVQNPVDEYHRLYPEKCVVGTEETSGAGTRGVYRTVPEKGWMVPLNRIDTLGRVNVIEYGWKFYKARPWGLGLFYWTGFDYRGEPNPMKWPATGSQFGIFDYCGFPKDEAFYLKAAWKDEPSVHICGPYGGEVWVYSNCDEVRLYESGKSLGRRKMPQDGHLVWKVSSAGRAARPSGHGSSAEHSVAGGPARSSGPGASSAGSSTGSVAVSSAAGTLASDSSAGGAAVSSGSWSSAEHSSAGGAARPVRGSASSVSGTPAVTYRAVGYRSGRKVCEDVFPAVYDKTRLVPSKTTLKADGQDVVVIDIYSPETELEVKVDNAVFLGWGNGDPGFKDVERPVGNTMTIRPFNGCAQVIVRSLASSSSDASSSSVAASISIAASCFDAASCSVTDSRGIVTSRGTATVTVGPASHGIATSRGATVTVTPASASSSASASTVSLSLTKAS